jgi:hypothetical protein
MTTMTRVKLAAEISVDPASIGYAGKTADEIVSLLNEPRENVSIPRLLPVGTILGVIGQAPFRIANLSEPGKSTAWYQVLANIRSLKEGFVPSDPSVAPLLTIGVADGVITPEEKITLESLGLRSGSRAEQLWGEGTYVTLNDVANAI